MKKGFTLIELLAVIVILAIIAIIAVPIVVNIIDDAKKSSSIRSAEFYISAIENAIATHVLDNTKIEDGVYPVMENGNICIGTIADNNCDNELVVEINGEVPSSGRVSIEKSKIAYIEGLEIGTDKISNGFDEKLIKSEYRQVCKAVEEVTTGNIPEGQFVAGDEYICKVNDTESFRFFVLGENSNDANKIDLIMYANINEDGIPVDSVDIEDKGLVAWLSNEDYGCKVKGCAKSDKGPITAMNYLNKATSSWTNIDSLNEVYDDIRNYYGGLILNGKARLVIRSELSNANCNVVAPGTCPLWISNYLRRRSDCYDMKNPVDGVYGYWAIDGAGVEIAYRMSFCGHIDSYNIRNNTMFGIRPVISVSKVNIQN